MIREFIILASSEGGGGFNPLEFDASALILAWMTFLVALLVLGKVCWKPLLAAVREREERIAKNIDSAAAIFTGDPAQNLGGSFDNDADDNIFKATFGGSFGSLSFGNVAQIGLSEDFVLNDLTVSGALDVGGGLGDVDLIYIPEPSSIVSVLLGMGLVTAKRRRVRRGYNRRRVCVKLRGSTGKGGSTGGI